MTANAQKSSEDKDPAESCENDSQMWERTARRSVRRLLWSVEDELFDALAKVYGRFGDGDELSASDIDDLRNEIFELERVLENLVTPHVNGVEPWERAGEQLTYGQLADALGVDLDDLDEL